ncbi:MAG: PAS domain-containing protein, partial [Tepidisphaeraceae bacterium]
MMRRVHSTAGSQRPVDLFAAGAVFALLALAIGIVGALYIRNQIADARRAAQDQLAAIADLKVRQIADWYRERQADAAIVRDSPMFVERIERLLADPNRDRTRQQLQTWMETLRKAERYHDVVLYDTSGSPLLWAAPGMSSANTPRASQNPHFQAALLASDVLTTDLHRSQFDPQFINFSLWIPIGVKPAPNTPADAVLRLRIDAAEFLYPLIQSWPTPSRTAETVLVRREGDDVVYLNELRHRAHTALTLREPLNSPQRVPANLAVVGQEEIVEGPDYRGVPVLAATRIVPGTPWFIVAKEDQEEIYTPLRRRAWTAGIVVGLVILVAALGVGLAWRQRNNLWLRRQIGERERAERVLKESEARQRAVLDNIPDPAWLKDVEGRYLAVNDAWCRFVGRERARVIGTTDNEWRPAELATRLRDEDRSVISSKLQCRYEQSMVHADGSLMCIDTFKAPVFNAQGEVVGTAGIGRDITARKQSEEVRLATIELLGICNQARDKRDFLGNLTAYFQRFTGCEAVGIRLREGVDFPYYEARGFPAEFVRAENSLCALEVAGQPVRDGAGNPVLECMCGNILSGRF